MDPTATHLPVWEQLFQQHQIKTVLEFGCGDFSTKFFVTQGCEVTSIEMQNQTWYDHIKSECPTVDVWLALGPDAWKELDLDYQFDAIFVDGHGDSRPECLMWAKDHTDLIVAHDTEHPYYDWDRANMDGFSKKVYDELSPWTTVWTRQRWHDLDGIGQWLA